EVVHEVTKLERRSLRPETLGLTLSEAKELLREVQRAMVTHQTLGYVTQQIIILCVRWYITFKLSFRDLVQMMAERGITLSHTTILRWVQQYVPEFEKRWSRYARPVGDSWRVDETYLKIKGQWVYLYRAVDKAGRTVDFLLSKRRD